MKVVLFRSALLLLTSLWLAGSACSPTAESDEGKRTTRLESPGKLKVLVLEGTPRNRGLIHGRAMKDQIHEVVRLWKAMLADAFKMDADEFIRRFISQTDFVSAIKKWTPDLLEEIQGLADGTELDFDTMLVLQLPDECFVNGQAIAGDHCSSLGFAKAGGRACCVAQNMDVPSFADGFQVVLHVKEQDSHLECLCLNAGWVHRAKRG